MQSVQRARQSPGSGAPGPLPGRWPFPPWLPRGSPWLALLLQHLTLSISPPRLLGFPIESPFPAEPVLLAFPTLRSASTLPPTFWLLPGALMPSLHLECILPLFPAHPCLAFQPCSVQFHLEETTTILPSPSLGLRLSPVPLFLGTGLLGDLIPSCELRTSPEVCQ